ncbi:hypothetical protein E2562_033541 [Oryza meyeriana var. granulata]|uniref:Uncharacterized protein n=1 Tax=Oryza meyeriana var. granulata TaxID=110450 RepID=A0A6G1ESB5_9ORYZ|nr:hypothetical protein E2562_033541 [Oryza meyeriana var. granulata]
MEDGAWRREAGTGGVGQSTLERFRRLGLEGDEKGVTGSRDGRGMGSPVVRLRRGLNPPGKRNGGRRKG